MKGKRVRGRLTGTSGRSFLLKSACALGMVLAGVPALAQDALPVSHGPMPAQAQIAPPRTSGPPNIILILADDFGVEGVNAYGGEYFTPNIDRLAREGMRFENAHATPLCSPSRTRIMTGLENHRNYEAFGYLAPGQRTFANVLKEAGYATGMVGKWQLMGNGFDGREGIAPEAAGFDESYLWQLKALDAKGSRYWGPTRGMNGVIRISEEGFGPDLDSDFALDFIDRHKDKPFFLYYSMVLVHSPFVPTPDSMSAEGDKNRFAGMVGYMDRKVGDLMARLKADGLDKNTIVIFTGDNGTARAIRSMRNGHEIQGGKGMPTVNGTHVPMIAWAPGRVPRGRVSDALFDFTDVLPTLADIAGAPVAPGSVDGVSQWPVMEGEQPSVRDTIFMHYAPMWIFEPTRFAFDAHWKLYGDGRFVSVDAVSGTETEVTGRLTGEAARRKAILQHVLDEANDGPLDQTRFPWCLGRPSRDPARPPEVAGCDFSPGGGNE